MRRIFAILDEKDRRILKRLELDARLPNQNLAAHVDLSASACLHRVRRLEQTGIILRYRVDIDEHEIGPWIVLWGEIVLKSEGRKSRRCLEEAFRNDASILEAHQVVGRADYLLRVTGPDVSIWPDLIERLDPQGKLIAASAVQVRVRQAKIFSGLPQLGPG